MEITSLVSNSDCKKNEDHEAKDDSLLTRRELARRWKVSIETLKRWERAKILRPMRLNGCIVRLRMSDVIRSLALL
jgi:hypothetical protein